MTTKQILIAAKALIDTPEKWTRHVYARNFVGREVDENDHEACKFCAIGALIRIAGSYRDCVDCVRQLESVTKIGVHSFNDTHTHAEVMAAFDKAIASCEEE